MLVTGGTGTLGRAVVAQLQDAGTDHRVLSRHPGPGHRQADLLANTGLDAALRGVETVINCATSPGHDVAVAQHLVAAASRAQVRHVVHISIVGIDRIPLGYYREKLAVEAVLADAGMPHTILRATQFHDLLARLFALLARSPVLPLPAGTSFQPVDTGEVAARLIELSTAPATGRVDDLGGPLVQPVAELARIWLAATSRSRWVWPVRLPGRLAGSLRDGFNCTPAHAGGSITFEEFVSSTRPGSG